MDRKTKLKEIARLYVFLTTPNISMKEIDDLDLGRLEQRRYREKTPDEKVISQWANLPHEQSPLIFAYEFFPNDTETGYSGIKNYVRKKEIKEPSHILGYITERFLDYAGALTVDVKGYEILEGSRKDTLFVKKINEETGEILDQEKTLAEFLSEKSEISEIFGEIIKARTNELREDAREAHVYFEAEAIFSSDFKIDTLIEVVPTDEEKLIVEATSLLDGRTNSDLYNELANLDTIRKQFTDIELEVLKKYDYFKIPKANERLKAVVYDFRDMVRNEMPAVFGAKPLIEYNQNFDTTVVNIGSKTYALSKLKAENELNGLPLRHEIELRKIVRDEISGFIPNFEQISDDFRHLVDTALSTPDGAQKLAQKIVNDYNLNRREGETLGSGVSLNLDKSRNERRDAKPQAEVLDEEKSVFSFLKAIIGKEHKNNDGPTL